LIYGDNLELTGIVNYSGHAVRRFLSLKSMVSNFKRQRFKQNGDYRINPWRRCSSCLSLGGN